MLYKSSGFLNLLRLVLWPAIESRETSGVLGLVSTCWLRYPGAVPAHQCVRMVTGLEPALWFCDRALGPLI